MVIYRRHTVLWVCTMTLNVAVMNAIYDISSRVMFVMNLADFISQFALSSVSAFQIIMVHLNKRRSQQDYIAAFVPSYVHAAT